jgi:two-component system chemotaxis sensor kinase CheA
MVVRVAGHTLVVPLGAIAETLSLAPGAVQTLASGGEAIDLRGHLVPLRDLGVALGYRLPRAPEDDATLLILGQEGGPRAAFVVDAIEDRRQAVIKGFQDSYDQVPGVAAATVLGDGKIALILDPADLIAGSARQGATAPHHRRSA